MKVLFSVLCSFILLFGCINRCQGRSLSILTVTTKNQNGKIVDRYPDYGDGRRDGCIVLSERQLIVDAKKGLISGTVTGVDSGIGLSNAPITIITNSNTKFVKLSDSLGSFEIRRDGKVSNVKVEYLGYRSFFAKF